MRPALTGRARMCARASSYRIYKGANNMIDDNLRCAHAEMRPVPVLADVCVFTFVRHPFDHFISAYNEVEFRWTQQQIDGSFKRWSSEWTSLPSLQVVQLDRCVHESGTLSVRSATLRTVASSRTPSAPSAP